MTTGALGIPIALLAAARMAQELEAKGVPREKALAAARAEHGISPLVTEQQREADQARREKSPRGMNKLEGRRATELEVLRRAGEIRWWGYERMKLRLANDCFYTPDFCIIETSGAVRFEETKGFWRDDARVKIKVAATEYPMFTFAALQWKRGTWTREEFHAAL